MCLYTSFLRCYIIMEKMECLMVLMCVLVMKIWKSTAPEILYVLSDNSTNASCSSQLRASLGQYFLDNGSYTACCGKCRILFLTRRTCSTS